MPQHGKLSHEIRAFIDGLDGQDSTIGELVDTIGDRGFGMLLLILAFPAALPVPAPGYATPFGIMMVILGSQIIAGRATPWLPERFRKRRMPYKMLDFAMSKGGFLFRIVEFFIRPRLSGMARSKTFLRFLGIILVLMAAMMSLPIPLTNTAPSFVIFMLAAGMLEEDGLFLMAGVVLAPVAAAIALGALYFAVTYGVDAVETQFKPMVKEVLGLSG